MRKKKIMRMLFNREFPTGLIFFLTGRMPVKEVRP